MCEKKEERLQTRLESKEETRGHRVHVVEGE